MGEPVLTHTAVSAPHTGEVGPQEPLPISRLCLSSLEPEVQEMARLLQTQRRLGSDPNGPCEHGLSLHLSPEHRAWPGHSEALTAWGPEVDTHKCSFLELSPNLP